MNPAQLTVADSQMLVFSTAGTDKSLLLKRRVELGRQAVLEDDDHGVAYFEWSADEDVSPDDEDTWRGCMPALGITQPIEKVRLARKTLSDGDFRRAYLNQWTKSDERVIPVEAWSAVSSASVVPSGALTFAADAMPDRSMAAIAVADGSRRAELVEHRGGGGWVAERLVELVRKHGGQVVVDQTGPLGHLVDELTAEGVLATPLNVRQVAHGTGQFFDAVIDRKVSVKFHPALELAVAGARKRPVGDAWVWGRAASEVDISPLVAVTLALGRFTNPDDPGLVSHLLE